MKEFFSKLSGWLYIGGYISYICYVARGKEANPLWSPWLIFAVVETIIYSEMRAKGAVYWQITVSMIGSWATLIAIMRYGKRKFDWWDVASLVIADISVAIWQGCNSVSIGIIASIIAMGVAMIKICMSAYRDPLAEDKIGWTLFFLSCPFALLAITDWGSIAHYLQPLSYYATEGIAFYLVWRMTVRAWTSALKQSANLGALFECAW